MRRRRRWVNERGSSARVVQLSLEGRGAVGRGSEVLAGGGELAVTRGGLRTKRLDRLITNGDVGVRCSNSPSGVGRYSGAVGDGPRHEDRDEPDALRDGNPEEAPLHVPASDGYQLDLTAVLALFLLRVRARLGFLPGLLQHRGLYGIDAGRFLAGALLLLSQRTGLFSFPSLALLGCPTRGGGARRLLDRPRPLLAFALFA